MESFRQMVKGWLGITMLALLAVPLVLVGMESYFSGGGRNLVAAEVNGDEIAQPALERAVQSQAQQIQARLGANARLSEEDQKQLRKQVLNNLIQRQLLLQSGQKAGYRVTDEQIHKLIRETPAFQEAGRFSPQRYASVLSQIGESPASFPERARQEVIVAQRMAGWLQSSFVTQPELERLLTLDRQTRDVSYVLFTANEYMAKVNVSDADIQAAYDSESRLFQQPEQVAIEFIRLSSADFANEVSITDEDIEARYALRVQALSANEQRRAAHILIADGNDAANKAKAESLLKEIEAGASFEELAKANSQDPGSAPNGGDLGFAARGMFEPDFESALFALNDPGQLSPVVKTPFGYHIIKLLEVTQAEVPSLASIRDEVAAEARAHKAEELYIDAIERLDAIAYESSDLSELAREANVSVQTIMAFSRQGGEGIAADPRVVDVAFSDDLVRDKKNSSVVSMSDGSSVWLRVTQHTPTQKRPLAQVRDVIRAKLANEQALALAKADAEAVFAKAKDLGLNAAAPAMRPAQQRLALTRQSQLVEPDLLQALFRAPKPVDDKRRPMLAVLSDSVVVAEVSAGSAAATPDADEQSMMRSMLAENSGQQELQDVLKLMRAKAKVKVSEQVPAE